MPGYVCGCDVGSTFGKAVIMDLDGTILGDATVRSKINPEDTSDLVIGEALEASNLGIKRDDILYLVGTGYGRTRILGADENISEISCHAMGVHVANPGVRTIIDIRLNKRDMPTEVDYYLTMPERMGKAAPPEGPKEEKKHEDADL